MVLAVSFNVIGRYVLYAPFVHVTGRDVALRDQLAQPSCGLRIVLVVIGCHR
jgi:hypothetical protein